MRPYATVSPLFWTGSTGKRLRSQPDAQRVAFYLMTSPHSHQSGMYYLPRMYLCHEVGISEEGASEALISLIAEGYCEYDNASEWVWVCEMAAWQMGAPLAESDKRCKGIQQYVTSLPSLPFIHKFIVRYAVDLHLSKLLTSPLQGAYEGASSEQNRTEQIRTTPEVPNGTDGKVVSLKTSNDQVSQKRGTRCPLPFPITDEMRQWAARETPNVDVKAETAGFEDYWKGIPGAKGCKLDWEGTWRNRMRDREGFLQRTRGNRFDKPKKDPYAGAI